MSDADLRTPYNSLQVGVLDGRHELLLEELASERAASALLDDDQCAQLIIDLRHPRDGMPHEVLSADHATVSVQHLETGWCWLSLRSSSPESYPLTMSLSPEGIEKVAAALEPVPAISLI